MSKRNGLPASVVNALRAHNVTKPETLTVEELLRIPGMGVAGVWNIANRVYQSFYHGRDPVRWPELDADFYLPQRD